MKNTLMPYKLFKGTLFSKRYVSRLVTLPVVDALTHAMISAKGAKILENTAVIYIHHALQTSPFVLKAMFDLGLNPEHTFVVGKRYSDNAEVISSIKRHKKLYYQESSEQVGLGRFTHSFTRDINLMWAEASRRLVEIKQHNIKNVLILDHGGYATNFVPTPILQKFNVVGLEKTSGGFKAYDTRKPAFPLINVANCAAKKILESPLIAEAILAKLNQVIDNTMTVPTECGVIGYGAIGKAITEKLMSLGHRVIIYDINAEQLKEVKTRKNLVKTSELSSLVNFSKFIFGCSGFDVTASIDAFRLAPENKTLISCSSEDLEFQTLLCSISTISNVEAINIANKGGDVAYINDFGSEIKVLRAGFPYNFDDSGESVPALDIQLTRALVLSGVLQATSFFETLDCKNSGDIYALDAGLQQFIAQKWINTKKNAVVSPEKSNLFKDLDWIKKHSPGTQESLNFTLKCDTDISKEKTSESESSFLMHKK